MQQQTDSSPSFLPPGKNPETAPADSLSLSRDPIHWVKQASELRRSGRYQDALELLEGGLELDPENLDARFEMALVYETGLLDYHQALRSYSGILERDPDHIQAWMGRGIVLYLMCNDRGALEAFTRVLELNPGISATPWIYSARLTKDPSRALYLIQEALRINPELLEGYEILGDTLAALFRHEEAIAAYERLLAANPGRKEILRRMARSHNALGQFEEALQLLEQSGNLEEFPEDQIQMALALAGKDRIEDALGLLQKITLAHPERFDAWKQKGLLELRSGRDQEALDSLRKALQYNGEDLECLVGKGSAMVRLGLLEDAIPFLEKILERDPDHVDSLLRLAEIHDRTRKMEKAIPVLERLIQLRPDDPSVWFQYGVTLGFLERHEEALSAYEKAVGFNEEFGSAWNNMGYSFYRLGKFDKAVDCYTRSIAIKADFAGAWYNRACSQAMLGRKEKSLMDLKKAVELKGKYRKTAVSDEDFRMIREESEFLKICNLPQSGIPDSA